MENQKLSVGDRIKNTPRSKWIKFGIMTILTILFVMWTGYPLVLILIPLFFDSYITKYIPWSFWRNSKNKTFKKVMEWVDAIVFALVVAWVVTTFIFQNYQIPSSSLEKTLLVGDFLCVSKVSFGARSPMTPLSFPLVQHTLPILNTKSYIENPQVKYKRLAGTGQVQRNDIVVFNYPSGDTVALNFQNKDYYMLCYEVGRDKVWSDKRQFGEIVYRPVDRRENYVKRCVGLPGETISMKDDTVYIDGKAIKAPENEQLAYYVQTDGTPISKNVFINELGITMEDFAAIHSFNIDAVSSEALGFNVKDEKAGLVYENVFLTQEMVNKLKAKSFVWSVIKRNTISKKTRILTEDKGRFPVVYPLNGVQNSDAGDFHALWIPKRGATITFDTNIDQKVAAYERCIKNYEFNDFEYKDGKVYINGKQADSYTFQYDYYFMMGDNRDNSADSRYWGFVSEDHIVGRPMFIWLSLNKDKGWFDGKIRWNRLFTSAIKN